MARTLHLVSKGQWYDMIDSGVKTEEYRETVTHWVRRLLEDMECEVECSVSDVQNFIADPEWCKSIGFKFNFKKFSTVTFQHGYSKDARRMTFEFKGTEIREGKEEWGAVKGVKYFVILLGNRIL